MNIEQILFSQGFGTRYECRALILTGKFKVGDKTYTDPNENIPVEELEFSVDGIEWPYYAKAIIMLNKPTGYECSLKPSRYPSVLALLPPPLRKRGLQPVGRLDADTTGLLLLTDDGALNHRLTHPKRHVPKTYLVETKHPVSDKQIQSLIAGVELEGGDGIVKAEACTLIDPTHLSLKLTQGKYHQVKRMLSAVSNRVENLKRISFGKLDLPADLPEGKWQWVTSATSII
ncbi:MAG: pseudouridine synthase [Burkholderiales bacterium]|nr:pseudouridine synthase [Burkholderiales bacterium]